MTRAVFEAKTKDDLKYFVALARRQGIAVKYLRVSLNDVSSKEANIVRRMKRQSLENTNSAANEFADDLVYAQISSMDKIWNTKEEDEVWSIL